MNTISANQPQIEIVWKLLEKCRDLIKQDNLDETLQNLKNAANIVNHGGSKKDIENFKTQLKETTAPVVKLANEYADQIQEDNKFPEKALPYFRIASFVCLELKDYDNAAIFEWKMAHVLQRKDKFATAISHYRSAEKLWKQNNESKKEAASALTNMGYLLFRLGRSDEAKTAYEDSIKIYKKFPMAEEMADAEVGLGRVLASLNEIDKAIEHYGIAEDIFTSLEVPRPKKVADIKINLGLALLNDGKSPEAKEKFVHAKLLYEQANDAYGAAKAQMNIGTVLAKSGCTSNAISELSSALSTFEELGYLSETRLTYQLRGLTHYYNLDFRDAASDLEKALEIGDQILIGVKSSELRASLNKEYHIVPDALCSSYLALHQKTSDFSYMKRAFNTLELAKADTVAEVLQTLDSKQLCIPEIKKELIEEEDRLINLIQQQQNKLLELASLRNNNKIGSKRFRRSHETLTMKTNKTYEKLEKLRLKVMLECAEFGNTPIPRSYNVLERTLDVLPKENWVILEFALLRSMNRLVVFLIHNSGVIGCFAHTVDLQHLEDLAKKCREIPEKLRSNSIQSEMEANSLLESLSKKLYSALMPEFMATTLKDWNPEYLIIVPHSYLHWIPFEAVFDDYEYWGLKYSMSTAFSLDLARLCVENQKKTKPQKPSCLLISDPTHKLGNKANIELEGLQELMKSKGVTFSRPPVKQEKATQKAVLDAFNNDKFDLLHYVGHALFLGKDPSQSSLILHTNEDCPMCNFGYGEHKTDYLSANEIIHGVKFKRTPIVYLSACETGISEVEPGDEMFGLVRALMYAGATSLILSHWGLANDVAPIFANEFYQQLVEESSVAVALRNARKKISKNYNITDWSILTLHGDPFRTLYSQRS